MNFFKGIYKMKSIIQNEKKCFICGTTNWLEEHHIFEGTANRKISEKYGLKIFLCHRHHNEPPYGVHHDKEKMLMLKQIGQEKFMKYYNKTKEEFIEMFGKNYL